MKVDKDGETIKEEKYAVVSAVKGVALTCIFLLLKIDMVIKHGKRVK